MALTDIHNRFYYLSQYCTSDLIWNDDLNGHIALHKVWRYEYVKVWRCEGVPQPFVKKSVRDEMCVKRAWWKNERLA